MTAMLAQADCPFLLNAKGTGGFADWEYETYSVETTSSGLSDVISLQSSDGGSPIPLDDPPRLESLQSFTSALSPFSGAAWASGDHRLQGLVTSSLESMEWAGPAEEAVIEKAAQKVSGDKKDETRTAKRVRRREQQKVAQQRYRQKQRHWAAEMEVKVDELARLHDAIRTERDTLAARRASLEDNVHRMEAALAEKAAQAATLRQRLGAQHPANEMAEPREAEPQQTAELAAHRLSFSVAAIKDHVERHLSKEGADLQSLPEDELQQLLAAYETAAAASDAESPARAAEGAKHGTARAAAALQDVVKSLRLTPVQCQTLAWIRDRQLKKMASLADARQDLNMRAMSQMLPTLGLTPACLEERLCSSPQTDGCTGVAEAAELDAAIDAIKANIKEECRAVTELNDLVMHRALTPAQLAVFIAKSFPCRPEGFAIINAVASSPGSNKAAMRPRRAKQ